MRSKSEETIRSSVYHRVAQVDKFEIADLKREALDYLSGSDSSFISLESYKTRRNVKMGQNVKEIRNFVKNLAQRPPKVVKKPPGIFEQTLKYLDQELLFWCFNIKLKYLIFCIFVLNLTNMIMIMNFYLTDFATSINYLKNTSKIAHTGPFLSTKQGFPPVDINSSYWGQQNENSTNMVNGITPKKYDLKNKKIEILLVPHTHLDPGWIETFEDYYTKKVKVILQNVIKSLKNDPNKKYTWCEISFLERFFSDPKVSQNDKFLFEQFLREERIEIVGGGWVQHDETLTNYRMQIRQMETGLSWLRQKFPFVKVETLWQIDPFGASANTPLLFQNFKYALLNRIGDQIKDQLKNSKNLDFFWSNPFTDSGILTHLTNIHYSTEQLAFLENEVANYKNVSFKNIAIPGLVQNHTEVLEKLRDYIIGPNLEMLKHGKIMLLVGNDFAYYKTENNAKEPTSFKIVDYLYYLITNHGEEELGAKIEVKIATSKEYFQGLEKTKINQYSFDFSQYDEKSRYLNPDLFRSMHGIDYWTGYYSNRAAHKSLIKRSFHNLHVIESFSFFLGSQDLAIFDLLSRNISIGAHHDSITGTSKAHVHLDEQQRFNDANEKLRQHHLKITKVGTSKNHQYLQVINPSLYPRTSLIRHNIESDNISKYLVKVNGKVAKSYIQNTFSVRDYEVYQNEESAGLYIEMPKLEPMSINFVVIEKVDEGCPECSMEANSTLISSIDETTFLENDEIRVDFDSFTFYPNQINFKKLGKVIDIDMSIIRYPNSKSHSGAYIHSPYTKPLDLKVKILGAFLIKNNEFHDKIVIFYKSSYINACFALINIVLNKQNGMQNVIHFDMQTNILYKDELYLRFKFKMEKTQFYVHDSINHVQAGHIKKRMLTTRDLGAHYYPAVSGASIRWQEYILSFFTGSRANGVGYKPGQIEFGIGRSVYNDDYKGLPDGTNDSDLYELTFSFGLFLTKDIGSPQYKSQFDVYENPILRIDDDLGFPLDQQSISFSKGSRHELISITNDEAKFLVKSKHNEKVVFSDDLNYQMYPVQNVPHFKNKFDKKLVLDQDYSYKTLEKELGIYDKIEIRTFKLIKIKEDL